MRQRLGVGTGARGGKACHGGGEVASFPPSSAGWGKPGVCHCRNDLEVEAREQEQGSGIGFPGTIDFLESPQIHLGIWARVSSAPSEPGGAQLEQRHGGWTVMQESEKFLEDPSCPQSWGLRWVERVQGPGHGGVTLDLVDPELGPIAAHD